MALMDGTAGFSFRTNFSKPIVLLPELQETGSLLFDRGSSWTPFISKFRDKVNIEHLPLKWEKKGLETA